jgi:hypothetical protein
MGIREDLLASATFLGGGISGGVYTDLSPNAVTGTVGAGITASVGPMGSAAIDGTGDAGAEVTIANANAGGLALAADMAWSFWAKPNTRPKTFNAIWSHGNFSQNGWYCYFVGSVNRMDFGIQNWILNTAFNSYANGTWYHFAVYLGATGLPKFYVNGTETAVSGQFNTRPATLVPSLVAAKLLDEEGGTGRNLDGELSEPFIMRRNFAAGEIAWLADPANSLLIGGTSGIIPILRQHYAAQGAR